MIRIGILGTAAIARPFFAAPLRHATIAAIASRSGSGAAAFAKEFAIPVHYGNYDNLLADPAIDAVYLPLPPSLHAEWTIRAAKAGKHVLVEKPAAPSAQDVERMIEACAAARVLYMEAFMYRFKAIHRHVRQLVTGGMLGPLRFIDFSWCFNIEALKRSLFRLDPAHGGGALNDLGVYGVDFLRYLGLPVPTVMHATIERHGHDGVDRFAHVVLRSGKTLMALTAGFTCDANYYMLGGEKGSVYVSGSLAGRVVPNAVQMHLFENDQRTEEVFPAENPYVAEMDHFAECIEKGIQPDSSGEGSLSNIRVLEEIKRVAGYH
jgi:D-xylose 1-dehydrogenase (NADP+, D-xylono-1,5-lactone-forming)